MYPFNFLVKMVSCCSQFSAEKTKENSCSIISNRQKTKLNFNTKCIFLSQFINKYEFKTNLGKFTNTYQFPEVISAMETETDNEIGIYHIKVLNYDELLEDPI